jgi:hypothetical protein
MVISIFFLKFAEIFTSQGAPPIETATGVTYTIDKFATGINDTGGKLPPAIMTPAVNLPWCQPVAKNGKIILLTP